MQTIDVAHHHDTETSHGGPCRFQPTIDGLRLTLNAVLRGKERTTEMVLACLLARGHILLEDLPGLGKTTLAKGLAAAIGGRFSRVQCTPDLLPGDITGFSIFNQKTREFEFQEGPVFTDILLADEINRATPRTQSALFEAMAERQVTIDKHCYRLADAFFVIATQNPIDSHGTFPLPEAQLDRFALRLSIGYPDRENEILILNDALSGRRSEVPTSPCSSLESLHDLQQHVASLHVSEGMQGYLVDLARASREDRDIELGISPRGLLIWQRMAQAWAHLQGRDFVTPDDVQTVARPVLDVRLGGSSEERARLIDRLIQRIPVPLTAAKR